MDKHDTAPDFRGIVTARKCDCCGHHELGVVTRDGDYIALKPGMHVVITPADAVDSN